MRARASERCAQVKAVARASESAEAETETELQLIYLLLRFGG